MKKIIIVGLVSLVALFSVACSKEETKKEKEQTVEINKIEDLLPKKVKFEKHFTAFNESLNSFKPETKEGIHLLSGKEFPFEAKKTEAIKFTYMEGKEKKEKAQFSYYQEHETGEMGSNFYIIDVYNMKENKIMSSGLHKKLEEESKKGKVKIGEYEKGIHFYHYVSKETVHSLYNNEDKGETKIQTTANEIYVYKDKHLYRISYLIPNLTDKKTQEFMENITKEILFGIGK